MAAGVSAPGTVKIMSGAPTTLPGPQTLQGGLSPAGMGGMDIDIDMGGGGSVSVGGATTGTDIDMDIDIEMDKDWSLRSLGDSPR